MCTGYLRRVRDAFQRLEESAHIEKQSNSGRTPRQLPSSHRLEKENNKKLLSLRRIVAIKHFTMAAKQVIHKSSQILAKGTHEK
jgi:hypothetical protein